MPITKINSLGITNPVSFSAGTAGSPSITFSGDTNTGVFAPAADTIGFTEGGAEAMRIDSSARVGIGVTSPIQKLQLPENTNVGFVGGTNNAKIGGIIFGTDSNFGRYGMIDSFRTSDAANIDLRFYTMAGDVGGILERMRIAAGGHFLLNTDSNASNYKGLKINNDGATGNYIYHGVTGTGSYNNIAFFRGTDGSLSEVGKISTTGSATSYVTSSDYRLKENVNYNFDATTRLKQLKPARFNFIIEPNKTVDGFLAHEVSNIIPEAITGTKDQVEAIGNITDVEDNIVQENVTEPNKLPENQTWTQTGTRPVYQGIDQSKLTPILTKALQEAIAKIEQLEARLTALESK